MRRRSSSISLASKLEEAEEKRNVSAERRRSTAYTFSVRASLSRRSRTVREPEACMPRSFPFSSVIVASRFAESLPDGERFVEARRGGPSHSRGRSAASMLAEKRRGTGRNVPLRFRLSDDVPRARRVKLMVSARSPERGPVSRSRLEMSFSAFPAATCSSLPPAMRKPPALSFQSERKAFAASGRAAVNSPSGRRVLTAGAGLAADGFAPGIASPMPPEEVTRTSGASTDRVLTEAERACVSKCRPLKVSARIRTAGEPASFPALRSAAERLLPRPKDSALTEASAPVTAREVAEAGAAGVWGVFPSEPKRTPPLIAMRPRMSLRGVSPSRGRSTMSGRSSTHREALRLGGLSVPSPSTASTPSVLMPKERRMAVRAPGRVEYSAMRPSTPVISICCVSARLASTHVKSEFLRMRSAPSTTNGVSGERFSGFASVPLSQSTQSMRPALSRLTRRYRPSSSISSRRMRRSDSVKSFRAACPLRSLPTMVPSGVAISASSTLTMPDRLLSTRPRCGCDRVKSMSSATVPLFRFRGVKSDR